VALLA